MNDAIKTSSKIFAMVGAALLIAGCLDSNGAITENPRDKGKDSNPPYNNFGSLNFPPELTKELKQRGVGIVMFLTTDSQGYPTDITGQTLPICGKIEGSKVTGDCYPFKNKTILKNQQLFSVSTYEGSNCTLGYWGGWYVQVDKRTGKPPCRP